MSSFLTVQCHVSSVPIYADLKKRSLRAYFPVVAVALSVCVVVYTITGVFGYLTFHHGHACFSSDILRNYCPKDPAIDVARVMLIVVMVTSYPILAFCGRYILYINLFTLISTLFSLMNQELLWITDCSSFYVE